MTSNDKTPEGMVADAPEGNWVDLYAPARLRPFLRLSRADRPIGTWLLLLPCWWGLTLAILADGRAGWHDLWIFTGCLIGAFVMRGAGCTWNDITDREFDAQVARTRSRPLPSGQVTLRGAYLWMALQGLIGLSVLLTFNAAAIWMGVLSLLPVAIYPFAKRFTWWPQVFLGLAFNWGALLAWVAHRGTLEAPALVLYLAGIAWTLFYDTIYAHQDTEDDALIGVKSTARLFGEASPRWLAGFAALSALLLAGATLMVAQGAALWLALAGIAAFAGHLLWQLARFDAEDTAALLHLFRSNRDTGLIPVLFFAAAALV